jgi:plasmid stabilization system protein ParE
VKLIFDPEALIEMREAAAFYEDCQRGLGASFLDAVEVAVAEIVKHPLMWRKVKGRFRRYLVQRFPYGLIYALQDDIIYIAAVMHLKRKPDYWYRRQMIPGERGVAKK